MSFGTALRPALWSRRPIRVTHPTAEATTARPARVELSWRRETVLLGVLYGLYELSRRLVSSDPARAMATGRAVLAWERSVHLDPEALLNHLFTAITPLAVAAAFFYATLHYVVTPAVLVWMYRRRPEHYGFARTSLALGTGLGLLGFYLVPTAPPRLLAQSGIHDTLAQFHRYGWWGGDGSVPRGLGGLSNQFAAMPSLHVGWAAWSGVLIAVYASRNWVRLLGALYPVATVLVVLGTGNHYLLDAVGGIAVMTVAAVLARTSAAAPKRVRGNSVPASTPAVARRRLPEVEVDVDVDVEGDVDRTVAGSAAPRPLLEAHCC